MNSKPRNLTIDALRTIAILAVLLIHADSKTLSTLHFAINSYPIPFALNQLARFAVPLFFLISGFVLTLTYHEKANFLAFFKKRVNKIFLPFVFWSAFYFFFVYPHKGPTVIWQYIVSLVNGTASYQLYFIPSLILLYLVFPLLKKYLGFFTNKWTFSLIVAAELIVTSFDYYHKELILFYPLKVVLFNFEFFLLGMLGAASKEQLDTFINRYKKVFMSMLLISTIWLLLEVWLLYNNTKNYLYIYSQWRPVVLFYTVSFTVLLYSMLKNTKIEQFFAFLSRYSFFVFFIHVTILEALWQNGGEKLYMNLTNPWFRQLVFDPLFFLLIASISFSIAYIMHKVPKASVLTG